MYVTIKIILELVEFYFTEIYCSISILVEYSINPHYGSILIDGKLINNQVGVPARQCRSTCFGSVRVIYRDRLNCSASDILDFLRKRPSYLTTIISQFFFSPTPFEPFSHYIGFHIFFGNSEKSLF